MSNQSQHETARVSRGVSKEISRYQSRQPEGYSRSKSIEDMLAAGATVLNGPPRWVSTLTSAAHFAAIATMVSGLFVLSGMSTPPVIAFCAASAAIMVLSVASRLLFARRREFR